MRLVRKKETTLKKSGRLWQEKERFGGGWRKEALQTLLGQLPREALVRLRKRMKAGEVYIGPFYGDPAVEMRRLPGVLMGALPEHEMQRTLDRWCKPIGPPMAQVLTEAWARCGVADVGLRFESEDWPGYDTSFALRNSAPDEVLEVIDGLLR